MDLKSFIDQILQAGKEVVEKGQTVAEEKMNDLQTQDNTATAQQDDGMSGYAMGAAGASILALLLGTKSGRQVAGAGLKLGSLAAVGGLAYQLYQNWQGKENASQATQPVQVQQVPEKEPALSHEDLLSAMVAAAKADGNVDEQELAHIRNKLSELNLDQDANDLVMGELTRPSSVEDVAARAQGNQQAALELYIVSKMMLNEQDAAEKAYLSKLQQALELPDDVVQAAQV